MLFRLASWMILQATLILPIYIGLGLIQVQRYYQLQDYKPVEQKKYLQWAYQFLRITSWVYIPQKVIPAAFALYWLGMSELNEFLPVHLQARDHFLALCPLADPTILTSPLPFAQCGTMSSTHQ